MIEKFDLNGKRFGHLYVKSLAPKEKWTRNYRCWECQCDCGNKKLVRSCNLISGNTKSCGCKKTKRNRESPMWKGYQEIPGNYFYSVKRSAKRRKIKFKLSIKDMWNLFVKQNRHCALSGKSIHFQTKYELRDGTASLDRIDSSKGYIKGNVQWVHKDVNSMKMDLSTNEFFDYCKLICVTNKLIL